MAKKKPTKEEVEKLAIKYGYSGLFGLLKREDLSKSLDYARSIGDSTGIMLNLALFQNRNAFDKAFKELTDG